jgi:hypothetical protein
VWQVIYVPHDDAHFAVIVNNSWRYFFDQWADGLQIGLSQRICGTSYEVSLVSPILEKMVRKALGSFRPQQDRRVAAIEHPTRNHEVGKITDVVMVQVRKKHHSDIGWIDICAHHLPCGTLSAIKKKVLSRVS